MLRIASVIAVGHGFDEILFQALFEGKRICSP